jgi:cytochrome c biogenesis protein
VEASVEDVRDEVLDAAREVLRGKRFRVVGHRDGAEGDSVSAEIGYLKETGNLVFHLALILVIVGVAWGHLVGWKGDVIVPAGQTFANTLSRYDTFNPGPWVDSGKLSPFTVRVDRLDATFEDTTTGRGQFGAPRDFTAYTTTVPRPGAEPQRHTLKVNHPLEMSGATVFLLGNGYAPVVTVRDSTGAVVYHDATPFLAQDNNYRSVGAIKVAGAQPKQLGFFGLFLPTAVIDPELGPTSIFPDARRPALALGLYEGELFPNGRPQSVYTLDTEKLSQVEDGSGDPLRIWLEPGQTVQLPGGRGSITFDGVERFAGLSVRSAPGTSLTLWSALLAVAGLIASLVVKRRRVFVRVAPAPDGPHRTVVTVAGLAKDDDDALGERLEQILDAMLQRTNRTNRTTMETR